jgi:hypothetical protein
LLSGQRAGRRGERVLLRYRHLLRRLRKRLGTREALMRACVFGILLDRSWVVFEDVPFDLVKNQRTPYRNKSIERSDGQEKVA